VRAVRAEGRRVAGSAWRSPAACPRRDRFRRRDQPTGIV